MDINDNNNQNQDKLPNQQPKKTCHGNRRNQRFRRKCRQRGMTPSKIEKLLDKVKNPNKKVSRTERYM